MKYYKFGEINGRYTGSSSGYDIYSNSISPGREVKNEADNIMPGDIHFNYGPLAGGLRETVNFNILTPGEYIKDIKINSHFKRRNIKIIDCDLKNALLKIERINGFHSASHSIAFLLAVEDALNIDNSKVIDSRIVELELERIRSNIDVLKGICESAGFSVPEKQLLILREEVARKISESFGHRYFFSVNNISSINVFNNKLDLKNIKKQFINIYENLLSSKIFLDRIQENGKIEDVESTGPAARASGYSHDARLDSESLPYKGFIPVIENSCDSFARFQVRAREVLESIKIIENTELKSVEKESKNFNGTGEGAARIESPAGDLFYYVYIVDGKIKKIIMVPPSFLNIGLFKKAIKNNNIFTDFFFVWESFGIWISELEVNFI